MHEESITPDLVELARRAIEADTYEEWDALAERLYAPDAVWSLGGMLGSLEGLPAIRAFVKDYWLMWDDHRHYLEETLDLGHGVMFGVVRERARTKGSDAYVEARNAWVSLWEEGRVVRTTSYADIDEARAAAERLAQERADG
jgi:ketosteroid isomerase-like protein